MDDQPQPGATGRFPLGQLNANDLGQLAVAIAADRRNDRILMDFGLKPIRWVAMSTKEARNFARVLLAKAKQLDGLDL